MFNNSYEPEWFEQIDNDKSHIQSVQCSTCSNGFEGQDGKIFCQLRLRQVKPFENCSEWEE